MKKLPKTSWRRTKAAPSCPLFLSKQKDTSINTSAKFFAPGTFAKTPVNLGRQVELDIAKGMSIIFMVWVHTMETFSSGEGLGSSLVENFFGGPFAAPVFMVCMGIGMVYARKQDAKTLARRGLHLFWLGLLLNIFRYVLPLLLGYVVSGEKLFLNTYTFLFGVDILQFAGLAFLAIALAKKLKISDGLLLGLALAASILGAVLKDFAVGNLYLDQFFGYIWADPNGQTYFPFINWIIFPVFGYVFGKFFQRCADKKAFYLRVSPLAGGLGLAYLISAYVFKFGMYGENGYYYHLGPIDALAVILTVLGIFGVCFSLVKFKDAPALKFLTGMSSKINTIYCIQWLIIGNAGILLAGFLPEAGLNFWQMSALAAIIVLVSNLLAKLYLKKPVFSFQQVRYALVAAFVLVAVVSLLGQTQAAPLDELMAL